MEVVFCPRCGTRREPGMGFCTRCGANLGAIETVLQQTLGEPAGRGWRPEATEQGDFMAPFLTTTESRPVQGAPGAGADARREGSPPTGDAAQPEQAPTQVFPRVRRPQQEIREEEQGESSVWRPEAARTQRILPVQQGGAQAPWIRPAGGEGMLAVRPVALLGGAIAVASAFLPWIKWSFDRTAFDFSVRFLIEGARHAPGLAAGVVLVALGAVGFVLSLLRPLSAVRRIVGLLVFAVPVLFGTLGLQPADLAALGHQLGIGAYAAAAGGLLLLLG